MPYFWGSYVVKSIDKVKDVLTFTKKVDNVQDISEKVKIVDDVPEMVEEAIENSALPQNMTLYRGTSAEVKNGILHITVIVE